MSVGQRVLSWFYGKQIADNDHIKSHPEIAVAAKWWRNMLAKCIPFDNGDRPEFVLCRPTRRLLLIGQARPGLGEHRAGKDEQRRHS